MKAMKLTALRRMEMQTAPEPVLQRPEDILIRVSRVGVCGSDVHYYTTGRIGSQRVQFPFAVGHEMSGIVEAVGSGVTSLRPGDRIALDPAVSCGDCDQCRAGRRHTCRHLLFLGCPGQLEGCLCEKLVMPENCCFRIPDRMDLEMAALIEPLSIGVYAVQRSIAMEGTKVGILGMGPIGFSVMLPALATGASAVYVTDRIDARLAMARQHGATWAGNPGREDIVQSISEREPLLLDVVFECCGQQDALDQAMRLLKPGGKLMIIGIPEFDRFSFSAEDGRRREICIQHVRRQNECVQRAIDMVATGQIDPAFMITHRYPFPETKRAFDLVDTYSDGVLKAMIDLD